MTKSHIFEYNQPIRLESGRKLERFHLEYTTLGHLNTSKNNVIWIFHAFTANSNPEDWWAGLVGDQKYFDPAHYFIICVNMPGSSYGSIGPLDINPITKTPYFHHFPLITTRDMIRCYEKLRVSLGIDKIYLGIGGSMGGQQLLEWAAEYPNLFAHIIPIATNAQHSPWGIAQNTSQRWAIEGDPTWKESTEISGLEGMKIARSMALLSYRSYQTYDYSQKGFAEETELLPVDKQKFRASSYQHYQGEKLAKRFNAYSYYALSQSMDAHDLGRGRGGTKVALGLIQSKALVIGISSDILFPPNEQKYIADHIHDAQYVVIDSLYGHDGFLLEFETIGYHIEEFLKNSSIQITKEKNVY
ncbi:homoserine O-acetyltransferase family protein [Rhizosphaericola mali]|uniref:Homoserine O-acetyltransferase n=1 Tax=Rhizosphaericola mali TaxID=2545455 RepID=A0A5P2G2F8_9BACT|nr:homoserine O-acetyltransferase [Rhizosphaericola mali]QES89986.1 homoserine O-acetyltransferase [Rhizosphaericola mali]